MPENQDPNVSTASIETAIKVANKLSADNNRVLALIARDYMKERKTRRRWGIFFKFLVLAYLVTVAAAWFYQSDGLRVGPHVAFVELNGIIGPDAQSSLIVNQALRDAFAAEESTGVILQINSPGGSPVQAAEINAEIWRLRAAHPDKPLYAVVSDICASGGYYVAVAADQIYANRSSLVGSIGVRLDGFGFVDTMEKLGVERRLLTAGSNKGMLDPFLPVDPTQQEHAAKLLEQIHQQFIDVVRQGRGDRLADNDDVFSGLFWSGEEAQRLGLVDEFGSAGDIARDIFDTEEILDYTATTSLLDAFAKQLGVSISTNLLRSNLRLQ